MQRGRRDDTIDLAHRQDFAPTHGRCRSAGACTWDAMGVAFEGW